MLTKNYLVKNAGNRIMDKFDSVVWIYGCIASNSINQKKV